MNRLTPPQDDPAITARDQVADRPQARRLAPQTVRDVVNFVSSVSALAIENVWTTTIPRGRRRRHRDRIMTTAKREFANVETAFA
jgi:hypothetical protein